MEGNLEKFLPMSEEVLAEIEDFPHKKLEPESDYYRSLPEFERNRRKTGTTTRMRRMRRRMRMERKGMMMTVKARNHPRQQRSPRKSRSTSGTPPVNTTWTAYLYRSPSQNSKQDLTSHHTTSRPPPSDRQHRNHPALPNILWRHLARRSHGERKHCRDGHLLLRHREHHRLTTHISDPDRGILLQTIG